MPMMSQIRSGPLASAVNLNQTQNNAKRKLLLPLLLDRYAVHAEVDLTHLKTMMVLLWVQKVILKHTGSSILLMTVAFSLAPTRSMVGGTMMMIQQTPVIGGSMMNQEKELGHKIQLTAQSKSTTHLYHL